MRPFRLLLAAILAILCIPLLLLGLACWAMLGFLVAMADDLVREPHGNL